MNSDQIIALVSLIVSGLSVISAFLTVVYQISKGQRFEKEKTKLEIYSKFIAYCEKKASGTSTKEDDFELMKAHAKLCLITDKKLNKYTDKLYKSLFSEPRSTETIHRLDLEMQQMWLRLKIFNYPNLFSRRRDS